MLDIKPVIFLAFANDRSGRESYLNALKKERIEIEKMLRPAIKDSLCEVVIEPEATPEDIFRVFNQYPDRIAIFHYAGHGSNDGLHLTSSEGILNKMAGSAGLAQLFGTQKNLKLIFLNACSTGGQIDDIKSQIKTNILTTSSLIADDVAVNFAKYFYQTIGSKGTLATAYKNAESFVKMNKTVSTPQEDRAVNLYRGLRRKSELPKRFPWQIIGDTLDWSLIQGGTIFDKRPEIEVFVAYAPEDAHYQKKLQKHLALLKRFKTIKTFSAVDITAGRDIKKALKTHLSFARLIILLVSVDFLADEYCNYIEQIAMERQEMNTAAIVPIYIRPFDAGHEEMPKFAKLAGLPSSFDKKKRFVTKWEDEDEAFVHIVQGLRQVIKSLRGK